MNRHNYFAIQCEDADGNITREGVAYNVTTLTGRRYLLRSSFPLTIVLGGGTGVPTEDDTRMFNWVCSLYCSNSTIKNLNDGTVEVTLKYTLLPTDYVGATFTEIAVGLSSGSHPDIATHAMLTDSLGNNVTIVKTDSENMHITAVYYVTCLDGKGEPDYAMASYASANRALATNRGLYGFEDLFGLGIPIHGISLAGTVSAQVPAYPSVEGTYNYKLNTNVTTNTTFYMGVGANEGTALSSLTRLQDMPDIAANPITNAVLGTGDGVATTFKINNTGKNIKVFKDGIVTQDYVLKEIWEPSTKTDVKILNLNEFIVVLQKGSLEPTGYDMLLKGFAAVVDTITGETFNAPITSNEEIKVSTWGNVDTCGPLLASNNCIVVFDYDKLKNEKVLHATKGSLGNVESGFITYTNGITGRHKSIPGRFTCTGCFAFDLVQTNGQYRLTKGFVANSSGRGAISVDALGDAYYIAGVYYSGATRKLTQDWTGFESGDYGNSSNKVCDVTTTNFYMKFDAVNWQITLNKLDANGDVIKSLITPIPTFSKVDVGIVTFLENNKYIGIQTYISYDYRKVIMFDKDTWTHMYTVQVPTGGGDKIFYSFVDDNSPLISSTVMPVSRGHNVIFNEPPANGTSITCSYDLVRLNKNANNIVDIKCVVGN